LAAIAGRVSTAAANVTALHGCTPLSATFPVLSGRFSVPRQLCTFSIPDAYRAQSFDNSCRTSQQVVNVGSATMPHARRRPDSECTEREVSEAYPESRASNLGCLLPDVVPGRPCCIHRQSVMRKLFAMLSAPAGDILIVGEFHSRPSVRTNRPRKHSNFEILDPSVPPVMRAEETLA